MLNVNEFVNINPEICQVYCTMYSSGERGIVQLFRRYTSYDDSNFRLFLGVRDSCYYYVVYCPIGKNKSCYIAFDMDNEIVNNYDLLVEFLNEIRQHRNCKFVRGDY